MSNPPNDRIERAALALREARATRHPIPPVSATHGLAGLAEAYAAAELNVRARLAEPGRRVVGKKVGLTSPVVQKQLGVDQPDFGVLFDDMEYLTGAEIPSARLIQPKMEAEVAFVMGADLGPHVPSWAEFLRAVEYALPALEIVDSAIADWKITLVDTVADNASSALYVLGDQPVSIGRLQLAQLPMTMTRGADALARPPAARRVVARPDDGRARPADARRRGGDVRRARPDGAGRGGRRVRRRPRSARHGVVPDGLSTAAPRRPTGDPP